MVGIVSKEIGSRMREISRKSGASSPTTISLRSTESANNLGGKYRSAMALPKDKVRSDVDTWLSSLD